MIHMKNNFIIMSCIYSIRVFLKYIFEFFPLYKNRILFRSYEGKFYNCNPKYISEFLREESKKFDLIWAVNDFEKYEILKNMGYKLVKNGSIKYYFYYITSKYLIYNDVWSLYVPHREKQVSINTWHGGGAYKKWGCSLLGDKYQKERYKIRHESSFFLSTCVEQDNCEKDAYDNVNIKILKTGYPRNDMLFLDDKIKIQKISEVRKKLNIPINKKVILYAPTYRENRMNSMYNLDITLLKETVQKKFDGEWIILFRGHYYLRDLNTLEKNKVMNVSNYDDMQEILLITNILVTDYSSSVWDFGLQKKPCFLYTPDIDAYIETTDFYISIEKWPFEYARNNQELTDNILNFSEVKYLESLNRHYEELGSYENGKALEKIKNIIY